MSVFPRRVFLFFSLLLILPIPACAQRPVAAAAPAQGSGLTVLLTNDDGYDAPGLRAMIEAMRGMATVYVAAPAANQSGKGHSIVTSDPIMVFERRQPDGGTWYAVDATPATCTRLALESLLPRKPDLVISGINRGENLGIVVYYSGTLGAAREAALTGVPALAVSMKGNDDADYAATAAYVRGLVEQLRDAQMLKPGLFLNINSPGGQVKGTLVTRLSEKPNLQLYDDRRNPRGRRYFWSDYRPLQDDDEGTDVWAFVRGFIAITPLRIDTTATDQFGEFKRFEQRAAAAVTP